MLLALTVGPFAAPARAGDGVTWMRGYVQQHQQQMMQRALGDRATPDGVTAQIIGGNVAAPGRWPFQVALLDAATKNNLNAQFCGGSLIDSRHVLTAAHCVDFLKRASQLQVLTGTQSLARGGKRRAVAAFKYHPRWKPRTSDYDIAVVTLAQEVIGIAPVAMIHKSQEVQFASAGKLAYVTGWGDIDRGPHDNYPTELHEVNMPLVSRAVCNSRQSYDGDITARMICAGLRAGGKDSCQGDSGGPLVVRDASGNYLLQAGIVSWGDGCAKRNFYGVYSRLAVLSSWAETVVHNSHGQIAADACADTAHAVRAACYDAAIGALQAEQRGYLDRIKRDGSPEQDQAAQTAQRAWSLSMSGLCAFAANNGGELGRKACILGEMRRRADVLAGNLAELGQ
jgi:secreted trypsin-like serine protease